MFILLELHLIESLNVRFGFYRSPIFDVILYKYIL